MREKTSGRREKDEAGEEVVIVEDGSWHTRTRRGEASILFRARNVCVTER